MLIPSRQTANRFETNVAEQPVIGRSHANLGGDGQLSSILEEAESRLLGGRLFGLLIRS
jgi:hypothetical protein